MRKGWKMFVGTRCRNPEKCKSWWLTPKQVHYHEDFDACAGDNDIAIFEHDENIPNFMATPICLPPSYIKIGHDIKAAGNGFTGPEDTDPKTEGFQVIEDIVMVRTREKRLVVKTPLGIGLCGRQWRSIISAE
ncbi:hypothetical protein OSTOST_22071 [Ostertagia ostertagi]